MSARSFRAAFSLVELLVAITLLVVVMLIGWGAFSRTRHAAQGASCIQRMRVLWMEWNQYTQETKGVLYSGTNSWMPIMHAKGVFNEPTNLMCPATTPLSPDIYKDIYFHRIEAKWVQHPISYTMNFYSFYRTQTHSIWEFTHRHETPLYIDGRVYAVTPAAWNDEAIWSDRISFRHDERANFLFVDGHAQALTREGVREINPVPK